MTKEKTNSYSKVWVIGDITIDDLATGFQVQRMEGRLTDPSRHVIAPGNLAKHLAKLERETHGFDKQPDASIQHRTHRLLTSAPCIIAPDFYTVKSSCGTVFLDPRKLEIAMRHRNNCHSISLRDTRLVVFNEDDEYAKEITQRIINSVEINNLNEN